MSDQQRKQLEALLFSESDDEIIVQADGSCLNITQRIAAAVEAERKACEEIARKWLKTEDDCGERGYSGHIADDIAARGEGEGSSQNEQD